LKVNPPQPFTEPASVALALLGQLHIDSSHVLARKVPGRLAVSRQLNNRKRLAHDFSLGIVCHGIVCRAIVISPHLADNHVAAVSFWRRMNP